MTNDGWQRLGTSNTTTFVDTTATTSNTYTYTVRAMDENGRYVSSYNHNGWEQLYILWHEAVYKEVYHPAETEEVWVVDVEGYTIEEPVYEYHDVCKGCGAFLDEMSVDEMTSHLIAHIDVGENAGYYFGNVQVGTKTVTVDEEGHYETRVVKEAWTEKVLVREAGYY